MQDGLRVHWKCLIVKSRQKPHIHFPEFKDGWHDYKLGEVYTERKEKGKDSLPILSVSIHKGVSDEELDTDVLGKSVLRSEDKSLYKHVFPGDLVLNMMRAWQGAFGVVKLEGMVSPAYITAIPGNQIFPLFMEYCLHRDEMIAQINNLSYGVTDFRKRLYWKSFINVLCHIPSVPEQKKITSFFTKLDKSISIHQQELNNLKQTKQGFLQKMFPKEGELVPEVRFDGFSGAWVKHKLGDIITLKNGCAFESKDYTDCGKYKVITIGNVRGNLYVDKDNVNFVDVLPNNIQEHQILQKGDILISMTGNVGRVSIVNDKNMLLNQRVGLLSQIGDMNYDFLISVLKNPSFINEMDAKGQGAAQLNIGKNDIEEYLFTAPSLEEQEKIGLFFKQLDSLIELHQHELDALKKTKKAFLQKMFI